MSEIDDLFTEAPKEVSAFNKEEWAKKCLTNIANSAYFSSDRTINEYVNDIWKLKKLK